MDLEQFDNIVHMTKNDVFVQKFIKELQNKLKDNISLNNRVNVEKEGIQLVNPTHKENRIIAKYRDKMYTERAHILNKYAKLTIDKGKMYYIYDKNSKMLDGYNLCICEEEKSHTIIEVSKEELPKEIKIGSILRKHGENYMLDKETTEKISQEIYNMKDELLKEQTEFLESKRIEGHIYEMSENSGDRAWLFDITSGSNEGVEEIDFPQELLQNAKERDLFIYKNEEYQKYSE